MQVSAPYDFDILKGEQHFMKSGNDYYREGRGRRYMKLSLNYITQQHGEHMENLSY